MQGPRQGVRVWEACGSGDAALVLLHPWAISAPHCSRRPGSSFLAAVGHQCFILAAVGHQCSRAAVPRRRGPCSAHLGEVASQRQQHSGSREENASRKSSAGSNLVKPTLPKRRGSSISGSQRSQRVGSATATKASIKWNPVLKGASGRDKKESPLYRCAARMKAAKSKVKTEVTKENDDQFGDPRASKAGPDKKPVKKMPKGHMQMAQLKKMEPLMTVKQERESSDSQSPQEDQPAEDEPAEGEPADESMQKDYPPLFTPLLTRDARAAAYKQFKGQCLNCLGDHSFRNCPEDFLNKSKLFNPEIGPSGSWPRWRGRMRSHRMYPKDARRHNSGSSRRNSSQSGSSQRKSSHNN